MDVASFAVAQKRNRKILVGIFALPSQHLRPGMHNATAARKCGRALPKGTVEGAGPFVSHAELLKFAAILLDGCSQSLSLWGFSLSVCVS